MNLQQQNKLTAYGDAATKNPQPEWHSAWIAFYTIVRREVRRFLRIWSQTLLPPVITVALYFIIFGSLIGPQLSSIKGFSYMEYIAPGLIMMAVINNAYSNVVGSFFGAKFQRFIEEILIAPVPDALILLGYVMGGVIRGLIVALAVLVVALFFTKLEMAHVAITLLVMLLAATLFSLAGFCNAVFAKTFDDIAIIPTFVLTPLIYLGGVFYSTSMLSPFWQAVSLCNPILYIVDAFRYGILGVSDLNIAISCTMMLLFVGLLGWYSFYLLHRGVGLKT